MALNKQTHVDITRPAERAENMALLGETRELAARELEMLKKATKGSESPAWDRDDSGPSL